MNMVGPVVKLGGRGDSIKCRMICMSYINNFYACGYIIETWTVEERRTGEGMSACKILTVFCVAVCPLETMYSHSYWNRTSSSNNKRICFKL